MDGPHVTPLGGDAKSAPRVRFVRGVITANHLHAGEAGDDVCGFPPREWRVRLHLGGRHQGRRDRRGRRQPRKKRGTSRREIRGPGADRLVSESAVLIDGARALRLLSARRRRRRRSLQAAPAEAGGAAAAAQNGRRRATDAGAAAKVERRERASSAAAEELHREEDSRRWFPRPPTRAATPGTAALAQLALRALIPAPHAERGRDRRRLRDCDADSARAGNGSAPRRTKIRCVSPRGRPL